MPSGGPRKLGQLSARTFALCCVARRSRRWRSLHSRFGETRKEAKACQRGISVEVNRGPVGSDLLAFT
jgi:hypothetical protein